MSCQPMLFLQTLLESKHLWTSQQFTCHQHITFATNESGGNSYFQSLIPLQTFMEMVKVLNKSEKIIKHYWHAFNILTGINNKDGAWEEVSVNYLNGVWCKLLHYARLYMI
jgi:hypothetical protein